MEDLDSFTRRNQDWFAAYTSKVQEEPKRTLEEIIPPQYHAWKGVFLEKDTAHLPPHRPYDIKIELLPGAKIKHGPIYSTGPKEDKELRKTLARQLEASLITPSTSPMASPIIFVKKKNGKLRLCVDYWYLNSITKKNVYPLPLPSDLIEKLRGAKIFTKFDLKWGYNLLRIADGDEWKTAFKTKYGLFEYHVMPFGLTNAPAYFQHLMNDIFRDLLDICVVIYLDDILVFSKDEKTHTEQVKEVLRRLEKNDLYCNPEKSFFHVPQVEYLGFIISPEGVQVDQEKVTAALKWAAPKNVKNVQEFLGFVNFYRRFIPDFNKVAKPMYNLLKKDSTEVNPVNTSKCQRCTPSPAQSQRGHDMRRPHSGLVGSLPPTWQSFLGTISWRLDRKDPAKAKEFAEDLVARIMDEDRRRSNTLTTPTETSLLARTADKSNIECYNCKKKGHTKAECWTKGGGSEGKGGNGGNNGGNGGRRKRGKWNGKGKEESNVADTTKGEAGVHMSCMATGTSMPLASWLLDSGSSSHTAINRSDFVTYTRTPDNTVYGIGGSTKIEGRGDVIVSIPTGEKGERRTLRLVDVNHVPESPHNLIGLGRLTDKGMTWEGSGSQLLIRGPKGERIGQGLKTRCGTSGSLYYINAQVLRDVSNEVLVATSAARSWEDWHRALGHVSLETLRVMAKEGIVKGMELKGAPPKEWFCDACIQGKQRTEPFPKESKTVVKQIGDLTVSDVWGPAPVTGIGGIRYYVSFIDVATRHSVLFFIKDKTEVQERYKDYEAFIFNKHGKALRTVRFDNGTEYLNAPLKAHIASKGTTIETTAPHSSSQNGISERLNWTIPSWGRSMRIAAKLPKFLWPQAFAYANFIKNRTFTRALPGFLTPYERFNGSKPDVSPLVEWGSDMWVLDQSGNNTKLDARSTLRKFVGVDMGGKAWLYWSPSQRSILASRNVRFPPRAPIAAEDDETTHTGTPDKGETTPETPEPNSEPQTPIKTPQTTSPTPTPNPAPPPLPLALSRPRRNLPPVNFD
ncbi:Transposon Tf2-1 polyprotein, putative, partial [Rhizoctonia solani AG-3 Rhs1AP]